MTRLGIIGSGSIGRMHAENAVKAGSTIVACCDVKEAAATALAADFDAKPVTSMDDLFAIDDVEAVVVSVPNHLHRNCAIAALEAGRDVLLEKPMAIDAAQCDEVIAAAAGTDRIVQVGFVSRYAPAIRLVRSMIERGDFGRLYLARAQYVRRRGIPGLGGWFTTKEKAGGGVLIDLGVHVIDLMLHLAGRPAVQRASGVCTAHFGPAMKDYVFHEMWGGPPRYDGTFDVEDGATAILRCDEGFTMEVSATWAANIIEEETGNGLMLLGDKGGAVVDLWEGKVRIATERGGELFDETARLPEGDQWGMAWTMQHELFAGHVSDRSQPAASMQHGREVQAVLDAIYRSNDEGREVAVAN